MLDLKEDKIKMLETIHKEYDKMKLEQMCLEEVVSIKNQEITEMKAEYEKLVSDLRFKFLEEKIKLQKEDEQKRIHLDDEIEQVRYRSSHVEILNYTLFREPLKC